MRFLEMKAAIGLKPLSASIRENPRPKSLFPLRNLQYLS
jgi:hypothetical protein